MATNDMKRTAFFATALFVASSFLGSQTASGEELSPPKLLSPPGAVSRAKENAERSSGEFDVERRAKKRRAPSSETNYLAVEKKARKASPEVEENLPKERRFAKRLPPNWGKVNLSDRQRDEIYRLQEEYNREIAFLLARIERLTDERDAKMRAVLTEKQRVKVDGADKASAPAKNSSASGGRTR